MRYASAVDLYPKFPFVNFGGSIAVAFAPKLILAVFADTLEIQPDTEGVWALVGPITQRNPENFGNNATFGAVVTPEGVILIDAGGSWIGAQGIDAMIDQITDLPVKYVINTGGQDHRWFGNDYWQQQGATVIKSASSEVDRFGRFDAEWAMMSKYLGDALRAPSLCVLILSLILPIRSSLAAKSSRSSIRLAAGIPRVTALSG